jgi:hypothetical protein
VTYLIDRKATRLRRCAHAILATSFLFFLVYSTPHRVHHIFDRAQAVDEHDSAGHHGPTDHQDKSSSDSDCVFQITANRCAFDVSAKFQIQTLTPLVHGFIAARKFDRQQQFLATTFQIRAPPRG